MPAAERRSDALHIFTLFSFAVAHPLFEVLHRNPEFFVAHRSDRTDVLLLVLALCAGLPAVMVLGIHVAARFSRRAGRVAVGGVLAVLAAALVLQAARTLDAASAWWIVPAGALGLAAAVAHARWAPVRTFATLLAPGLLLFPILFLLRPSLAPFIAPQARVEVGAPVDAEAPVVVIVFDQLPLVSLLDADGRIDGARYPAFAALADTATWFRHATTVSDGTGLALPAIVTGRHAEPETLPVAEHHPRSLFTLLGASYRLNVAEPLTSLCPQELCPHEGGGRAARLASVAADLALVYLHVVAPLNPAGRLPPVTQTWRDFAASQALQPRWDAERATDRRRLVDGFIESIEDGDAPALHFLHVLLPHEPFVYLPSGQIFTSTAAPPGLRPGDHWEDDELAVAQGYQQHLLQVGYVDRLLGRLVSRLQSHGLFERSLLVVTSDHGASFRPGRPFRALTGDHSADIAAVPLLVKLPGQRVGEVSDRNVETIDILPTIADALGIRPGWPMDGVSVFGEGQDRVDKTFLAGGTRRQMALSPFLENLAESLAWKHDLLMPDGQNRDRVPRAAPFAALIGRRVRDVGVAGEAGTRVSLDGGWRYADVNLDGPAIPAHLTGQVDAAGARDGVALAVAVNGTIHATTRSFDFLVEGRPRVWSAIVPPDAFRQGRNDIEIFSIARTPGGLELRPAYGSVTGGQVPNLASPLAVDAWEVRQSGLYDREWLGGRSFRWTDGAASLVVPVDPRARPQSLRVVLAMSGVARPLQILVDACEVFAGEVPSGRWSDVFSIEHCPLDAPEATIELLSDATEPRPDSGGDERRLGVAVETVNLLLSAWPPAGEPLGSQGFRSELWLEGEPSRTISEEPAVARISVRNVGQAVWPRARDLGRARGSVRIGIRWHRPGRLTDVLGEERFDLPQTMFPGDELAVPVALRPAGSDGRRLPPGRYEIRIALLQEGVAWFHERGDRELRLTVTVTE